MPTARTKNRFLSEYLIVLNLLSDFRATSNLTDDEFIAWYENTRDLKAQNDDARYNNLTRKKVLIDKLIELGLMAKDFELIRQRT